MFFFFQAEDGIRDLTVTGVQTCALPIYRATRGGRRRERGVRLGGRDQVLAREADRSVGSGSATGTPSIQPARDHRRTRHAGRRAATTPRRDRKSTRLNSSHSQISYAVFCLKKKTKRQPKQ